MTPDPTDDNDTPDCATTPSSHPYSTVDDPTTNDPGDLAAGTPPDTHVSPADQDTDTDTDDGTSPITDEPRRGTPGRVTRILTFVLLPVLVLALAIWAGYERYLQVRHHSADTARAESVAAAKDITVAMLSYTPDSAAATLAAARDRTTGALRDSYTSLINDVVIPGAQQKHISAVANVAAAASISATDNHAVVLVFVNQSITQGQDAPTATASTVRVTLDKAGTRWLAAGFDPK
jgi:Mce-associated membrane protein